MEIRLDQITDEPFQWRDDQTVPVGLLKRSDLVELSEISWSGQVVPTEAGFLFQAEARYEQTLTCMRCLVPTRLPVASTVELLVLSRAEQPTTGEYSLEADDLSVLFVDEDELETQSILEEQLQLNVPMRTLCREDCAGLCPACGGNRNQGPCGCRGAAADPRWAGLAEIRDRLKD